MSTPSNKAQSITDHTEHSTNPVNVERRAISKAGAIAWTAPMVAGVTLPVHAQTSATTCQSYSSAFLNEPCSVTDTHSIDTIYHIAGGSSSCLLEYGEASAPTGLIHVVFGADTDTGWVWISAVVNDHAEAIASLAVADFTPGECSTVTDTDVSAPVSGSLLDTEGNTWNYTITPRIDDGVPEVLFEAAMA